MSKTRSRLFLLFVFLVCALPLVLSYFAYYVWQPQRKMNYGELLDAPPLPAAKLQTPAGAPLDTQALRGKWVLVLIDSGACDENCRYRLYAMRQARLAMGVKQAKLVTLWLVADAGQPADALLRQYPDLHRVRADAYALAFPQPALGRIFLLDPEGKPLLRYPERPEPARMIRDLARLLDVKRM